MPFFKVKSMIPTPISYAALMILFVMFIGFGFGSVGCGVKGPPIPPQQPPVPAVSDLAYEVAGQAVMLTWSLAGPLSGRQAKHATFGLYRSRTALGQPACDGCPLVFEKMARIPYVFSDAGRYSTDVLLDPGYRYVFKVRLETDGGAGSDSNAIQFDHWPDVPSGGSTQP
jgi:hypothetical protein